ncbi:arrestin homolog [Amphibalanus amphitrite]|uniref:arrestin homolog n=1 Tax=Amphibalanus amphitrite TaxID=1232801 RepID=UPI001C91D5E9|nr:arrestin homolog [Amphibalanus amphitrite]
MQRTKVYKKVAPNNKIVLYVENREVVINGSSPPVIRGVVIADSEYLQSHSLYGQLVLVFRYGREDEEVMGLTFSNIIILQTQQLHPMKESPQTDGPPRSTLQKTIERHLSACGVAHAFQFQVSSCAPPSVSLYPAKSYTGAPLGTSYEVHFFAGKAQSEKPLRRASVRMTVRLCQLPPPSCGPAPRNAVLKQFLLSGGRVHLEVSLQKEVFVQEQSIAFRVFVNNGCKRTVRKIKAEVVQAVDVAMFKSGKFKSVVASVETTEGCPVVTDATLVRDFELEPRVGSFKNWIALEDSPERGGRLSPSVVESAVDWSNFAVHVSYYVKVKLLLSGVGGGVSVRVPFISVRETAAEPETEAAEKAPDKAPPPAADSNGDTQEIVAADVHATKAEDAADAGHEPAQNNNVQLDENGKVFVRQESCARSSDV